MGFNVEYPQALLQPWGSLQQFSEELYAMLVAEPPAQPAPKPAPAAAAAKVLEAQPPAPESPPPQPMLRRARAAPTPLQFQLQVAASTPTAPEAAPASLPGGGELPAFSLPQAAARQKAAAPSRPDDVVEPVSIAKHKRRPDYNGDPLWGIFPGPKNRPDDEVLPALAGKVVSGSGDTYQVTLYPNGKNADPQVPDETVMIYQIDSRDVIPPDTWITGIAKVVNRDNETEYWAQIPIWLA